MVPNKKTVSSQHAMLRRWRSSSLLMKYVFGFLFCMSIAHAAPNSIIWEHGDQIVRLAKQDDDSASPNDHPIRTTPGEVAAMLKELRLRYANEETDIAPASLFTKEEIDNLSEAIATGLGRATSSQDVIFHVIGTHQLSRAAFSRRNRVSAGRVFYRNGNYNIIFGQIQTPHRKKNVYGQTDQDFYPRNYGKRTTESTHDVILLPESPAALYQSGASARNDWVVIGPGVTAKTAVGASQPVIKPDPAPTPVTPAPPVAKAQAAVTVSPSATKSVDTAKERPAGASDSSTQSTADVEERLRSLKRLREQELISEDAYQAKMKEILQDL